MSHRISNLTGASAVALVVLAATLAPARAQAPAGKPPAAPAPAATAETAAPQPFDAAKLADQALGQVRARLKLTDVQIGRIKPLLAENMTKIRQSFAGYWSPDGAMFPALAQEVRGIRENFRASLEPILTPDQMKEFMVIRHEVDQELHDTICDARFAGIKPHLALRPDQEPKVRAILCEDFEKKRDLIAGLTTPPGAPAAPGAPSPQYKTIEDETEARLGQVLTPEQMKAYLAYRGEMKAKQPAS
jgi:hypothetical protein